MRNDVPLLGRDGYAPEIIPDLIGVFRAAQKQGPLSLSRQAYFNSWFLSGLFHHKDVNTHLTLRARPTLTRLAYEIMQYAINENFFADTQVMGRRDLANLVDRQERMIAFFARRLESARLPVDRNIRALAQTGLLFNAYVTREREEFRQRLDQRSDKKIPAFQTGIAPFVPAHFAAHMMHIMGQRMRDNPRTERLAYIYNVFLAETRDRIPCMDVPVHTAGERMAHEAVEILRAINLRLQEILQAPDNGSYLPKGSMVDRRLIEELFMATKPYREPLPAPAPAERHDNNVTQLDAWRGRKSGAQPAPV